MSSTIDPTENEKVPEHLLVPEPPNTQYQSVSYIYERKIHTGQVPVEGRLIANSQYQSKVVADEEKAQSVPIDEKKRALVNEMKVAFNNSSAHFHCLMEENPETKRSPLTEAAIVMRRLDKKQPGQALLCRSRRVIDGENRGKWSALEISDMNEEEVGRNYPEDVRESYKKMATGNDSTRLLVLDNVFFIDEKFILHRVFIYWGLHGKKEAKRDYLHAKTVQIGAVMHGYNVLKDNKSVEGKTEEEKQQMQKEIAESIAGAVETLQAERIRQREALMRLNMPKIISLVWMVYADVFVHRIDSAAPNLPQRMMLRIPIEKQGSLIDLDEQAMLLQSDIDKQIQELTNEYHETTKKILDMGKDFEAMTPEQRALGNAECERMRLQERVLKKFHLFNKALDPTRPDAEILFQLIDYGQMLDFGTNVDLMMRVAVPYTRLREVIAFKKQHEVAAAAPIATTTNSTPPALVPAPVPPTPAAEPVIIVPAPTTNAWLDLAAKPV